MSIVLNEMKKIWNIKLLLIISVFCVLFYLIFMKFYIIYFPNGHPETEMLNYSIEMMQQYGATLEDDEFSEFILNTREELIFEAETYIKNMPIFAKAGIFTLEDYEKIYNKNNQTELEDDAVSMLFGEEFNFVLFKLQALSSIEIQYHNYPEYTLKDYVSQATSEKELERFMEIQRSEEYRNLIDASVLDNTVPYTVYLAILEILAVLVLISPLIVTDRTRNIHLLQYTTKHGRIILNKQLIAIILSAFVLITALLLIFGAIYSTNNTWMFWNNGLTSFLNITFLYNMTYGQYILIYIVLLYALGLTAATAAFVMSRFSQNFITLILKIVPIFAMIGWISASVFDYTFKVSNTLYKETGIWGIEAIICGLFLMVGLAVSFYSLRKEKSIDVA